MKEKKTEEQVMEEFVNRCIDTIIDRGLIEGVTDKTSFAEFALKLDKDDDRLVEGIGNGAALTLKELSDEERAKVQSFSMRLLGMNEHINNGGTRRADKIEEWSEHLLIYVHNRIRRLLEQELIAK